MGENDFIVRARGLPFSASCDEVTSFFAMCRIAGGKEGIHFVYLREGRPSGEAFVELETEADFNKALEKNNDHMGHRYIEVFKATRVSWSCHQFLNSLHGKGLIDKILGPSLT